jgi:hypothetical protein
MRHSTRVASGLSPKGSSITVPLTGEPVTDCQAKPRGWLEVKVLPRYGDPIIVWGRNIGGGLAESGDGLFHLPGLAANGQK